jgi:hypothetical protein
MEVRVDGKKYSYSYIKPQKEELTYNIRYDMLHRASDLDDGGGGGGHGN